MQPGWSSFVHSIPNPDVGQHIEGQDMQIQNMDFPLVINKALSHNLLYSGIPVCPTVDSSIIIFFFSPLPQQRWEIV